MRIVRKDEDAGLAKLLTASVHRTLVIPAEPSRGESVCGRLALPEGGLLEAVAKGVGGILIDQGWIHLLGSGNRQHMGLIEWNTDQDTMAPGVLIVAMDAVGGAFAVNRSQSFATRGEVCYFSPRTLRWHGTGNDYGAFLEWILTGDIQPFFAPLRWPGWDAEAVILQPNHGISVSPHLSDADTSPLETRPRMAVKMKDLWKMHQFQAAAR